MENGKTAVVSGAAKGIGRAIAEKYLANGWNVAVLDILTDTAEKWAGQWKEQTAVVYCDISDVQPVKKAVGEVLSRFGRVDALVNNAGIIPRERTYLRGHDEAVLRKILDVNLMGTFYMIREFGEAMIRAGNGGAIVSISSVSGHNTMSGSTAYACAKAGIASITRNAAIEWGRYGIRANIVAPGQIMSDMTRERFTSDPAAAEGRMAVTPLGRFGETEDIANAVFFLGSGESSYISGEELLVDGGVTVNMYHVLGSQ